jgi:Protein of unknown function (DUF2934)
MREVSRMEQALEERIRERAYEIWSATGRMHGHADEQWLAAEREVLAAESLSTKSVPARKSGSRARSITQRGLRRLRNQTVAAKPELA